MNEKFDLQEYLTKGVERIVGEAVRATLKNPRESAFMLKVAALPNAAGKPKIMASTSPVPHCKYHKQVQSSLCRLLFTVQSCHC